MNALSVRISMAKLRVLLVEDSERWREYVRQKLHEHLSIDIVGEVSDGLEAVQLAEQLQPDIVLLDIGLPGLNGIEACGWICRVAPQAKVLFLTEQRDNRIVHAAMSRGAWGYILKSECHEDLITAISSLSKGMKFINPHLSAFGSMDPEECS